MSDLSLIAATLSDYAVSAAKNNWNEKVSRVHLVKAIRRWDTERFDSEFPSHAELVDKHLSQTKGDTLKPDGFDEDVLSDLQSVSQEDDVWILAKKLLEAVEDILRASNSTDGQSVQTATQTSTSKQEVAKVTVAELKPLPMMLNDALAIEIANLLSEDVVEVRKVLYADALYVAHRILGGDYPEMLNA